MPIYKMSDKQYEALKSSRKHVTHQDIIDECNNRLSMPIIKQTQIHLEHNNGTKFLCHVAPIRFIKNVVTQ